MSQPIFNIRVHFQILEIGFVWLCFPADQNYKILRIHLFHMHLCSFTLFKIGFVFSKPPAVLGAN